VVSPLEIDLGELEIEHNGSDSVDHRFGVGGQQSCTMELGTGLTPWWHSEIELGFDNDPGNSQPTLLTQLVTENTFQLTEPGEAIADFAFYVEYGQSMTHGSFAASNELTFGPVISKDIGRTTHTVNLFLTHPHPAIWTRSDHPGRRLQLCLAKSLERLGTAVASN
jgi:hypothetical protein